MDGSASDFALSEFGCNYCDEFIANRLVRLDMNTGAFISGLANLVDRVKAEGRGKKYDCIVGVSGGLDSSWVLYQAHALGLRPLAVHMDNGWNSELATHNIRKLVEKLDIDLYTYVIDWSEYRSLLRAFLDSDVIDLELLYDNAATAVCYAQARAYGIRAILSGSNTATEGFRMPPGWSWKDKRDVRNIKAIGRSRGVRLKTFPSFSNLDLLWHRFVLGIEWIPFLDYTRYEKEEALTTLEREIGFKRYPYKHYESVFTRFYQGHILPEKFKVDKRKVHLSTLILTSQISRKDALDLLAENAYGSEIELRRDMRFILKKLDVSAEDFEAYLERPERSHDEWRTEAGSTRIYRTIRWGARFFRKFRAVLEALIFKRSLGGVGPN